MAVLRSFLPGHRLRSPVCLWSGFPRDETKQIPDVGPRNLPVDE